MSFGISTIEHGLAVVAGDIVKGAKAVDAFLQAAVAKGATAAPVIEGLTAIVDPAAVVYERAAFQALGLVAKAAADADAATAAKGISISLDQQTWQDFVAVYNALKSKASFLATTSGS